MIGTGELMRVAKPADSKLMETLPVIIGLL
jgi:hypothetical protein